MTSAELSYRSSIIHYYQGGTPGAPLLICFHGYGESGASFALLEKHLGGQFMICAPDLPFHGQTRWEEGLDCSPAQLLEILGLISGRPSLEGPGIILAGYSLGGRVALGIYALLPGQVRALLLVAPDGLRVNPWYRLATRTGWGNALFKWLMKQGRFFTGVVSLLGRSHLVNQSFYKFVRHYVNSERVRHELYVRWTTLRHFGPQRREIRELVRKHNTPVRLVYGEYDRIIPPASGRAFTEETAPFTTMTLLAAGHQLLQEKHAAQICALLKN